MRICKKILYISHCIYVALRKLFPRYDDTQGIFLPISSSLDSPHKLVQHYDIVSLITTTQYSSFSFPKKLHILSVQSWFTSTVKNNIHVNTEAVTCTCFIPACIPSIPVVSSWYRLGVKQLLWWYLLRPKWWETSWKPQLSFTLLH